MSAAASVLTVVDSARSRTPVEWGLLRAALLAAAWVPSVVIEVRRPTASPMVQWMVRWADLGLELEGTIDLVAY